MKKSKLFLALGSFIALSSLFISCTKNSTPSNSETGKNSNSSQLVDSDSSIDSGDSGYSLDNENMWVAAIPNEFMCFGEIYTTNYEEGEALKFGNMIGYLINENELDFWKSKDNNNDLVYALATGNGMFRKIYEGEENLKNRYELYSQDGTYDCLAIKGYTGGFILFYRQGGNYENI